jgi:hypothetical protein
MQLQAQTRLQERSRHPGRGQTKETIARVERIRCQLCHIGHVEKLRVAVSWRNAVRVSQESESGLIADKKSRECGLDRLSILAANRPIFNEVRRLRVVVEGLFNRLYLAIRFEHFHTPTATAERLVSTTSHKVHSQWACLAAKRV